MTRIERVSAERAYILHVWPYRESSTIFDCLSESHGRVRLIGRAVKSSKGGNSLRAFNCLSLSWSGRSDLKSLGGHELLRHRWLAGEVLVAALYVNELTLRALRRHKAEESLFTAYHRLLMQLEEAGLDQHPSLEPPLRIYELELLRCIGYAINFHEDCHGERLRAHARYAYESGVGLRPSGQDAEAFSGAALQALSHQEFSDVEVRRTAKRLTRIALAPHIGPDPIRSRELKPI